MTLTPAGVVRAVLHLPDVAWGVVLHVVFHGASAGELYGPPLSPAVIAEARAYEQAHGVAS